MIEDTSAWRTALDRTSGIKVKDDATLLKKSIKRQDRKKKLSKKNWEQRTEKEENRKNVSILGINLNSINTKSGSINLQWIG
jgi:hypothetical protein